MNDRFKFRFWRKDSENNMVLQCADLMSIDGSALPYDDSEGGAYCYFDNAICEQCTGLKDKNGKLIYEGDVVKETLTDFINEEIITVVKWDELNAMYNLENLQNCEREVIGNIYENKELLNE